jgi:hypothetical protein
MSLASARSSTASSPTGVSGAPPDRAEGTAALRCFIMISKWVEPS